MKLLVMQSSPLSCYPVLLSPNIFLSTLFLNTLNGCCTINMRLMKNNPKVETVTKCSSSAHRAHFNASARCLQLVETSYTLITISTELMNGWISDRFDEYMNKQSKFMYRTLTTKTWVLPVFKIKQSRKIIL
jgi:hypothetical protein